MTRFLLNSLAASVLLTIVLNVVVRLARRRAAPRSESADPPAPDRNGDRPRIRVYVPWRTMILVSLVLTALLNLVAWLGR